MEGSIPRTKDEKELESNLRGKAGSRVEVKVVTFTRSLFENNHHYCILTRKHNEKGLRGSLGLHPYFFGLPYLPTS